VSSTRGTSQPVTSLAAGRGEIRALTGLRIVAAVWVVLYHFPWREDAAFVGFFRTFRPVIASGWLGVDLFFVLSGFVITHTYLTSMGPRPTLRGSARFLWARFSRVWPLWALVTCCFWLWLVGKATFLPDGMIAYQRVQPPLGVGHLVEQLLMVQIWHGPSIFATTFVGPGWSISAEWLAYVCFPLVVLVAWRIRRAHAVVTGTLALLAMVPFAFLCYRTGTSVHDWAGIGRIAAGFASGTLACLAVRRMPRTPQVQRVAAVVCGVCVVDLALVIGWAAWRGQSAPDADYFGVAVLFMPVLVATLALSTTGLAAFLGRPAMVYGGRISFALYLVHMCLFEFGRTVMDHVPGFANGTALGTLLLPQLLFVALLAAHLLHKYVEEPSRVWLRGVGPDRWWRSDRTVTAPPFAASMPSDDTVVLAREQLIGMAPRSEPPVTVR
jgi:peptidoglycan/LPS O-acetylase OafA/YrhL